MARNWRALLDKVCTILILAALQDATEEWCPLPAPLERSMPSASLPETLEDLYALVISSGATVLKPLKSKKEAPAAAADCTHPKKELKGGGNSTSSYVYCQRCHSRWAMDHRAADMKKYLKEEKGGPLKRQVSSSATRAAPDVTMAQVREMESCSGELQQAVQELREQNKGMMERILKREGQAAQPSTAAVEHLGKEVRRMAESVQERGLRQETLLQYLLERKEHQEPRKSEGPLPEARSQAAESNPAMASGTVKCDCRLKAKLMTVVRETPQKGRRYWMCQTGECDFFQWVPTESEVLKEVKRARTSGARAHGEAMGTAPTHRGKGQF